MTVLVGPHRPPRWALSAPGPARPGTGGQTGAASAARRCTLAAAGLVPVTLVALSTFGLALRALAVAFVIPAVAVVAALARRQRSSASLVLDAWLVGTAATLLYDVSRLGFMAAGVVERDPIPHIGTALGLEPAVLVGYVWRYLGNGSGLALTFIALGLRGTTAGVAFGLAVCGGLLVTLAVSPHGQEMLFPLGAGTVVMAITGHAVFGAVLGALSAHSRPPAPLTPGRERATVDQHVTGGERCSSKRSKDG